MRISRQHGVQRLNSGAALLLATLLMLHVASSQSRKISITATAGYGLLNLNAVDVKNSSDVDGWTRRGIPVGAFSSVKQAPYFSARVTYRPSRDFALSVYGSYSSTTVSSSYSGSEAVLQLDRGVGATDLTFGVSYYPVLQPYFMEWYLQAQAGIIFAQATARAIGTEASKPAGVIVMVPLVDSEGKYRETKTSALLFLGADIPLTGRFFLKGELGYRVAQVGEMDGSIRRFDVQSTEASTTVFDFSGVLLNLGIGFQL